ncbi:MAG: hypothetical protein P4K94_09960 [Terracidiphilus sp.]|nr:hypothetical protein [Terracidiphilus sp.]
MYPRTASLLVLLVLAFCPPHRAAAQTHIQSVAIVDVPQATPQQIAAPSPSGQADLWNTPPTLTLIPHSPQAHPGKIWLATTDEGLHIWGQVQADDHGAQSPQDNAATLSGSHVEVWLSGSPAVPMPAIGWGNQFGPKNLASPADCAQSAGAIRTDPAPAKVVASCQSWYTQQLLYRQDLSRLFVRQWAFAPDHRAVRTSSFTPARPFEAFASTAWASLSASLSPHDLPTPLQPRSDDGFLAETAGAPQPGYSFHIFIPYSAFPPVRQLRLADLYLDVDVFSAAPAGRKLGGFSSTASARLPGQPATFNHLRLSAPRTFSFSPCDYALAPDAVSADRPSGWFFPTAPGAALRSTIGFVNPSGGYMNDPVGVSPETTQAAFFWRQLASGASACGPRLAWSNGSEIKRSNFSVDEKYFSAQSLPDGWSLLRSGPSIHTHGQFGSGMCGACQTANFDIYAVSPQGEIATALHLDQDLSGEGRSPEAADLAIAPDWSRIVFYREFDQPDPTWTSITYCLHGHTYELCGESKLTEPPQPANFKELRAFD